MAVKDRVTGFNIYKDKRNRDIYYDVFTKEGYVITPEFVNKMNFYQKRLIIPIVIFALTYTVDLLGFKFGVIGASVFAIIAFVALEYLFRFRFLKSMIILPNFVPNKKENYFHQLAASTNLSSLVLKGVLYLALGVLLILFGFQEQFKTLEWIVCISITIVIEIVGCFQLYAAYIKHNSK